MASSSSSPMAKPEGGGGGGEASEAVAMVAPIQKGSDELALYRGLKKAKKERASTAKERISKMPPCTAGKRSSIYRGVTRHRWTGRYEAHLWDKSTWNQNQNKKGKQVYLGAYDDEEAAARAYDLAALKYWGPGTLINFPVTDYKRDIEEMQNVSREDYLASLRRKSSGFSRGVAKYRPLSSRWDPQFGRVSGAEYFTSVSYGDDATTENEYTGGLCSDRKIDLTSYIKWWGSNKPRQTDSLVKSSEEPKQCCGEDFGSEFRAVEWSCQPTEPYEMPCLGVPQEGKQGKRSSESALSILLRSAAFKRLQDRGLKKKEIDENDENENKNIINKMDYGKVGVERSGYDAGNERLGFAISGGLPIQRNVYPLAPLLSAPLLTNYNTIDTLADPVLWTTSLVPVLPAGTSRAAEVTKNESSSDYTLFHQE